MMLKHWIGGVAMLLLVPASAQAHVSDVAIDYVVQLDTPAAVAVSVKIETIESNMINGSEALLAGGMQLGNFAPLLTSGAMLSPGKHVLFASPAFIASSMGRADISIPDALASSVSAGAALSFRGSFGETAGSYTIPTGFGVNKVALEDGTLLDLGNQSVELIGIDGNPILLGTGPVAGGSSGGCSAVGDPAASWQALTLVGLAIAVLRRRRR